MKIAQQQLAKELFLYTGRNMTDIARELDIDRKTLYNWSKKDHWEELKIANRQRPTAILERIYDHIDEVNEQITDRCPTMQEVEMLRKLLSMTKLVQQKNTGTYIDAFDELEQYAGQQDESAGQAIRTYADSYVKDILKNKSLRTKQLVADISYSSFSEADIDIEESTAEHTASQHGNEEKWGISGNNKEGDFNHRTTINFTPIRLYAALHEAAAATEFPISNLPPGGEFCKAIPDTRLTLLGRIKYQASPAQCQFQHLNELAYIAALGPLSLDY